MRVPGYAVLDEALAALSGYGASLRNGNFNHAPMVAEALCALGRPAAVMPWIERYRDRLQPAPESADRETLDQLRRGEWRGALSRSDGFAAWCAWFSEELRERPWRAVLETWVARLAPGFCGAATHGTIRVGHAVRSLRERETAPRLSELADALASWAISYQALPARTAAGAAVFPAREALRRVAVVPPEKRLPGNITRGLKALDDFAAFAPAIGLLDLDGPADALLAELSEAFARVYLANARSGLSVIAFIHGVTSVTALGHIVPELSEPTARTALRFAWQAGCGLYACFGGNGIAEDIEPPEGDAERLIDAAVANGDEHVIKFTEACLWRHARAPSPAYLAAISHALRMLGGRANAA